MKIQWRYITLYLLILLAACQQRRDQEANTEPSYMQIEGNSFVVRDTVPTVYRDFFQDIDTSVLSINMKDHMGRYGYGEGGLQQKLKIVYDSIMMAEGRTPTNVRAYKMASSRLQALNFYGKIKTLSYMANNGELGRARDILTNIAYADGGYGYVGLADLLRLVDETLSGQSASSMREKLVPFDNMLNTHLDFNHTVFQDTMLHRFSVNELPWHGRKKVLLFGASWCSPCVENDRLLTQWYDKIDTSKVLFVNISIDKNIEKWRKLLEREQYPFASYHLPQDQRLIYDLFRLDESIPWIILLDEQDRLIAYDRYIRSILKRLPTTVVRIEDQTS